MTTFLVVLLTTIGHLIAQEMHPVLNYDPAQYSGANQNWDITQDSRNFIYLANNGGLLQFDGSKWKLYPTPNGTPMSAVLQDAERLYTGSYMDYGYWEEDAAGNLIYTSLVEKYDAEILEDEQFWNILQLDQWVLFQSLARIYLFHKEVGKISYIQTDSGKSYLFVHQGVVFLQKTGAGIFRIENGELTLVSEADDFKTKEIVGIFGDSNKPVFVTSQSECYTLSTDGQAKSFEIDLPDLLKAQQVFSFKELSNGNLAFGTISKGLFVVDKTGALVEHFDKPKGLQNNTVLSIFEDRNQNIWLGLDNGTSVINTNSPFTEFVDREGSLGVVYASIAYKNRLYLGTNQGLFVKSRDSEDSFRLIAGTNGQVWSLQLIDDTLFCGHHNGTYVIEADNAKRISELPGTWQVKRVPGATDLLIQGHYEGLSLLARENGTWTFLRAIDGFRISSRHLEWVSDRELLVNHEFKGLFILSLNETMNQVLKVEERPPYGSGTSLISIGDKILYSADSGFFQYNPALRSLELDTQLTENFYSGSNKPVGIVVPDKRHNRLWGFTTNTISYLEPDNFDGEVKRYDISIPTTLRNKLGVLGFENISALDDARYLIGVSNGYLILDLNAHPPQGSELYITEASYSSANNPDAKFPLSSEMQLSHFQRNISYSFSVPEFQKYTDVFYRYRLQGDRDQWSPWTESTEITFSNLAPGSYTFEVEAQMGNALISASAKHSFEIKKPWYASIWAKIIYVLLALGGIFLIHTRYRRYYRKQQRRIIAENERVLKRKKLKAKKKLVQIKNESLKQEISGKNRELAVATMSLIKKNQFLNRLKEDLRSAKDTKDLNQVIRTIDRNINNKDDWQFFEEAFNNADKDFLKKVKDKHPDLTSNDLKLCAYLRLNLTSKEIAPLLNISVRSVEVKRYRLRKKMDLSHQESLIDHILAL